MLRRLELEESAGALPLHVGAGRSEPIVAAIPEAELESALLPHDHPRWVKDAIAVSQRARDILAKLRPMAVEVLCFWDHRIRSIVVGDRRLSVDPSGCYRADM
jgi:hypothetical protein